MRRKIDKFGRAKAYRRLLESIRESQPEDKKSMEDVLKERKGLKHEFRLLPEEHFKGLKGIQYHRTPNSLINSLEKSFGEKATKSERNRLAHIPGIYDPEHKRIHLQKYPRPGIFSHELRHHAQNIGLVEGLNIKNSRQRERDALKFGNSIKKSLKRKEK